MREPERIDAIIEQLRLTWKAVPDMRLGQLIINAAFLSGAVPDHDERQWNVLYNLEDHVMTYGLGALYITVSKSPVAGNALPHAEKEPPQDDGQIDDTPND